VEALRILVVRHAEPVVATVDGPPEPLRPLTERGRRQAEELAERLGLEIELLDALREWRSGLRPRPDWRQHYLRCWSDPDHAPPGAESHRQAQARMLAALQGIVARWRPRGGTVVAGTHGTVISLALAGLGAPVDAAFWLAMPMPAVYRFEVDAADSWSSVSGPGLPPAWAPARS
jgi:2,3-bisphosphoglycerate-dependent phosphoglycerate mutase